MRRAGAEGAAAHFECRNEYRHYGSDHIIFIGHIERYAYTHKPTLLFCGGKYMRPDTSRTRRPRLVRSSPSHGAAVLFRIRRSPLTGSSGTHPRNLGRNLNSENSTPPH